MKVKNNNDYYFFTNIIYMIYNSQNLIVQKHYSFFKKISSKCFKSLL